MSISRPSTNRRKKTHRPTSDCETKVFPKRMEKNLHRQNSFRLCKRIRNSFVFKTFSAQDSRLNPRILDRVSFIKIRNRQIASERSNRTSGKFRTRIICEPPFHSSEIKWPKTSCYQFEAAKQTRYNQKFRMESLGNIRSLLKPGGFMIKIDLQDAYMSVPVAPKSRSLLVFMFDGKIYRFKGMPFGLNSAPRIFTKLIKQILRLLRAQGMLLIIHLDDILLIAPTADLCLAQGKFLMKLLQDLGFLVNINKSVLTPTQRIIFLGFLIDSVNMTISLPEEKQLAIIQKANSLLAQNLVSIRNLCQFVGMCSATRPALRQLPLFYRKIQLSVNKVLSKAGLNKKLCYNQEIRLSFQVRQNLQWWAEEMPHHCSAPVFSPPVDVKIATDSSFLGWGATMGHARIAGLWEWERLWSHINKKELQTCFIALEYFVSHLRDIHVQLSVDNTAAVSYLNHAGGTKSQALSDLAIAIWEWCLQRKIYLSAIHIPGIANKTPDGLSRQKLESTEWMLDSSVFRQIVAVYQQPQVDLFASHHNHQLPNYFSWIPDPRAMETDAFSIPWKFNLCYLYPPFPLIQKCIQKIKQDQTDALLITPVWKSRPWYPLLLEMLMDLPALLPIHAKLLHLPMFPSQVHPLIEKKINLAVWPVSGNPSKSKGFLKGVQNIAFLLEIQYRETLPISMEIIS